MGAIVVLHARSGSHRAAHMLAGVLLQAFDCDPLRFIRADVWRDGYTYHTLVRFNINPEELP